MAGRSYIVYSEGKECKSITDFSIKMQGNYEVNDGETLSIYKINNTEVILDFASKLYRLKNKLSGNILMLGKLEDIIKTKSEIERKTGFDLKKPLEVK